MSKDVDWVIQFQFSCIRIQEKMNIMSLHEPDGVFKKNIYLLICDRHALMAATITFCFKCHMPRCLILMLISGNISNSWQKSEAAETHVSDNADMHISLF